MACDGSFGRGGEGQEEEEEEEEEREGGSEALEGMKLQQVGWLEGRQVVLDAITRCRLCFVFLFGFGFGLGLAGRWEFSPNRVSGWMGKRDVYGV